MELWAYFVIAIMVAAAVPAILHMRRWRGISDETRKITKITKIIEADGFEFTSPVEGEVFLALVADQRYDMALQLLESRPGHPEPRR